MCASATTEQEIISTIQKSVCPTLSRKSLSLWLIRLSRPFSRISGRVSLTGSRNRDVPSYDVSLGADICTWAHLRAIEQKKVGNVITQPCAAIVKYVESYQPKLLKNLSPIHSPVCCAAIYVKKYLRRNNPIAFLLSMYRKEDRVRRNRSVDYNVTFKKLMEYFDKNGIAIPTDSDDDLSISSMRCRVRLVLSILVRADSETTSGSITPI